MLCLSIKSLSFQNSDIGSNLWLLCNCKAEWIAYKVLSFKPASSQMNSFTVGEVEELSING